MGGYELIISDYGHGDNGLLVLNAVKAVAGKCRCYVCMMMIVCMYDDDSMYVCMYVCMYV
jgi:hypothetical protein